MSGKSRSFRKGLSLKRKLDDDGMCVPVSSYGSLQENKHFLSVGDDTLLGCFEHLETAEKEALGVKDNGSGKSDLSLVHEKCNQSLKTSKNNATTFSGLSPIVHSSSTSQHGLSPIQNLSGLKYFSSPSSPILTCKSLHSIPRCLVPEMLQSVSSNKGDEVLAIPVSGSETGSDREDERDLFEDCTPKSNTTASTLKNFETDRTPTVTQTKSTVKGDGVLNDSGCEGNSVDDEEEKPWENTVYVPQNENKTPKRDCSSSGVESDLQCQYPVGVRKLTSSETPRSDSKYDVSLQGLLEINWDETLRPENKSMRKEDSPRSISFSEKLRQHLLNNNNREFSAPSASDAVKLEEEQPFFGLPLKVKALIQRFRGIKELYDWQRECLSMPEVRQRQNLVYALPTSGGKTLVAEILLLKEVLMNRKNTLFILPYVSIVQEKVRALAQLAVELDFFVEEYAGGKGSYPPKKRRCKNSVYIATIEKGLGLVHNLIKEKRLQEIGLVIVDELHLLGEGSRGATLEAVLTNLRSSKYDIQIVGMSATIGNLPEIASFLDAKTFTGDFRPVELKEYIKCGQTIYQINRDLIGTDKLPLCIDRTLASNYTDEQLKNDPDEVGALVAEIIPDESCLVFCPSRKNCENVAVLICQNISKDLKNVRVAEKKALFKALAAEGNGQICPILYKTLPFGVAYHHSGLTTAERRLLEEAFLAQTLCVICCTSTLAAGVNLPARRVILRSPYIGIEFIDLSRYKQMVGRAGRAGFGGLGESILMCQFKDHSKVLNLLASDMTESLSYLATEDGAGLKALILHSVSLGLATCRSDIHSLLKHTLLWVQAKKLQVNVIQLADQCIQALVAEGGFCVSKDSSSIKGINDSNIISALVQNDNVSISSSTALSLSKIGEAAVKGSFTMENAHRLYGDLHEAQGNLVLLNHLHLLYVVTPYSMVDQIKYVHQVYFTVFMDLSTEELKVAKALGITEAVMVAVVKRRNIKGVSSTVVDRFYLTLMLYDLWHLKSIWEVSTKYQVSRGQVFSLLQAASSFASCVMRFCEALEEFWCYKVLLEEMVQRLSHCCSVELIPLMELPAVKIGRARQLYNAGYHTLQDVACADPMRLIRDLDHMPRKAAYQIIAAAKLLLLEKAESLRDEASEYLQGLTMNMKGALTPVRS